jgi:hypothetical protein
LSTHIADKPMVVDLKTSTMQQARAAELHNRRGELNSAIADLERVKRNAGRGNAQASYDGYLRTWSRIERLARCIFELTGEESTVPAFDPPLPPHMETKTQRLGKPDPFSLPDVAKPAKPIPDHIPVGSARWYRIQGQTPPEGCPE